MSREPDELIVSCNCGAQWHGRTANAMMNAAIADHAGRFGVNGESLRQCGLLAHGEFVARYPKQCGCKQCMSQRRESRLKRKSGAR